MMDSQKINVSAEYKGIDGWLLLLCICFTIFNPLATVSNLVSTYIVTNPYFDLDPWLLYVYIVDRIISIGVMIFGIYAGIALWKIRPNAVEIAKKYLLFLLGYLIFTSFIPVITVLPSRVAALPIYSFVFFAICYSYLNKSKRVKATYEELYSLPILSTLQDILAYVHKWLPAARNRKKSTAAKINKKGREKIKKTATGADIKIKEEDMEKALLDAAKKGDTATVKTLLDKGTDVNAKDNGDRTALMWAVAKAHPTTVQILLDKGADVNAKDKDTETALMAAAFGGHRDTVHALLNKGADVNAHTKDGWTALMFGAGEGKVGIVEGLLDAGADVNAKNEDGVTALMLAEKKGHTEIVELLRQGGVKEKVPKRQFAEILYYWLSESFTKENIEKKAKGLGFKIRNNKDLSKISAELSILNLWLIVYTCEFVFENEAKRNEFLDIFHHLVYEKHIGGSEEAFGDWMKSIGEEYAKYNSAIRTDHTASPFWIAARVFNNNLFGEVKKDSFRQTQIIHHISLLVERLEKLIRHYNIE